jgi:hypothetical protein
MSVSSSHHEEAGGARRFEATQTEVIQRRGLENDVSQALTQPSMYAEVGVRKK